VQALAGIFTERAIKTLGEIMEDVKAPPAARALGAMLCLIARGAEIGHPCLADW
jgi:hypothetical protein